MGGDLRSDGVHIADTKRPDLALRRYGWTRPDFPYWRHPDYAGEYTTAQAWELTARKMAEVAG